VNRADNIRTAYLLATFTAGAQAWDRHVTFALPKPGANFAYRVYGMNGIYEAPSGAVYRHKVEVRDDPAGGLTGQDLTEITYESPNYPQEFRYQTGGKEIVIPHGHLFGRNSSLQCRMFAFGATAGSDQGAILVYYRVVPRKWGPIAS
jgi:hypothetical protein